MLADISVKSKPTVDVTTWDNYLHQDWEKNWEGLNKLPQPLKILIVLISGKSLSSVRPFRLPSSLYLLWCSLSALLGVWLVEMGLKKENAFLSLIPLGWILTTHSARLLRLTLQHAAAHNAVFESNRANAILGEVSSIVTISTDFKTYRRAHSKTHHNSRKLMTPGDETYTFWTEDIRLEPGSSVKKSNRRIIFSLFSPFYHLQRFLSRAAGCFLSESLKHNLLSYLFWTSVLSIVVVTGTVKVFIIGWLIPLSVLFESCSVLRQLVEHRCPTSSDSRMTAAIYLADIPPHLSGERSSFATITHWSQWWMRLLSIHLLSRLLVLPGDSPNHPKHHNDPASNWRDHIFSQSEQYDFPENFGLLEAVNDSVESWSQLNKS